MFMICPIFILWVLAPTTVSSFLYEEAWNIFLHQDTVFVWYIPTAKDIDDWVRDSL